MGVGNRNTPSREMPRNKDQEMASWANWLNEFILATVPNPNGVPIGQSISGTKRVTDTEHVIDALRAKKKAANQENTHIYNHNCFCYCC